MGLTFDCPNCGAVIGSEHHIGNGQAQCFECDKITLVPPEGVGPGTTIAGFKIVHLLGTGGMGQVYLATQVSMDRDVALKLLPPAMTTRRTIVQRFMQEVRISAKLEHPNIVTAFDAGEDSGFYYLAMAYVEGVDLQSMLIQEGALTEQLALLIAGKVADALHYAWDNHKMLHRDIKPANIMLDDATNVKLMDMGISKSMLESSDLTTLGGGGYVGTPYYMSPEQANAPDAIDCRSDIYALGATLYHLVTGERPFDGPSPMNVMAQHLTAPLVPAITRKPSISQKCSDLLSKMLAKDPTERHCDWQDLIDDIKRLTTPEHRGDGTKTVSVRIDQSGRHVATVDPMDSVAMPINRNRYGLFSVRVLIVDDDPRMLAIIEASMPDDYVIKALHSGLEAVQCLETFRPDIVLLDINMPGLSGIELLELIRQNRYCQFTRVLMVSGEKDHERRIEAYQKGADDFIAKPFDYQELRLKVQRWSRFTRFEELNQLKEEFLDLIGDDSVSPFPHMLQTITTVSRNPQLMMDKDVARLIYSMESTGQDFVQRYRLLREYMDCRCETYDLETTSFPANAMLEPFLPIWQQMCSEHGVHLNHNDIPDTMLKGDIRSMRRVVRWIFTNALEHAKSKITLNYYIKSSSGFFLDVLDDGDGFSDEILPMVFSGFQVGNKLHMHNKHGLHLSLAKEILKLQGGDVGITQPRGESVAVRIRLPLARNW